ncbi:hypothetical protein NESM_000152800 [Novymonas esmeraldas]|uniref:PRORP domain-containing protein n=1 Tax=Novymonas esmeraldas TaxID=1808958 RepID=A0AAW0F3W7_9TRYP
MSSSTQNGDGAPAAKRLRTETVPDIPATVSDIPEVQRLALENNAQTRLKHRRHPRDFLNHAFDTLGAAAAERQDPGGATVALQFLREMAARHQELPRNTVLSKVLYRWDTPDLVEAGLHIVREVLSHRATLPDAFAHAYDERVAAVALRLAVQARAVDVSLMRRLLDALPADAFKRRVFHPLFAHCHKAADVPLCFEFFNMARAKELEMWDTDYHEVLCTISAARGTGSIGAGEAALFVTRVLDDMACHHPVVGAANARLAQDVLGGVVAGVGDDGVCSHCAARLVSFDLSAEDRAVLVHDLVEKLVRPRVQGSSRYEPDTEVSSDTVRLRWKEFDEFKAAAETMPYDTVIDGANVGYYGLNSWYTEAKDALLRSRGVDPASVSAAERFQVPFPVDVAPKFSLIEDMRTAAERSGRRAVIVLHNRHLLHPPTENAAHAARWREMGALLPSPAFLNDDYCWLYAVLMRRDSCIISNDQMRDHHFTMLQPRFFVRWRQRHRITYKAMYNKAARAATLRIHLPRVYSVWVQACGSAAAAAAAAAAANTTTTTATQQHWHIPYIANVDVIHQATNQTTSTSADVDLGKDGDDECTDWICTGRGTGGPPE